LLGVKFCMLYILRAFNICFDVLFLYDAKGLRV
jgi:hypothetical protein